MINGIKNNLSFQAGFIFNGTKPEKDDFVSFLKDELINPWQSSQHCDVDTYEYNGSTIVLTNHDCDEVKSASDLPEYIKNKQLINSDEFYDKKKKDTLPDIVDVDASFGTYDKIISSMRQGITTYLKRSVRSYAEPTDEHIARMDFNNQVNILDAIDMVDKLNLKAKTETKLAYKDYKIFKEVIETDPQLKELKVTGIAGAGFYSIAFNIDKDKVLKISTSPCYPQKFASFDLPAIEKGWLRKDWHTVYYCILPKAQNSNEYRLTKKETTQIIDTIYKRGYDVQDMTYKHFDQIVRYNGKPYLCDYDCARHKSGKSRLFEAPKPSLNEYYPEYCT